MAVVVHGQGHCVSCNWLTELGWHVTIYSLSARDRGGHCEARSVTFGCFLLKKDSLGDTFLVLSLGKVSIISKLSPRMSDSYWHWREELFLSACLLVRATAGRIPARSQINKLFITIAATLQIIMNELEMKKKLSHYLSSGNPSVGFCGICLGVRYRSLHIVPLMPMITEMVVRAEEWRTS